MSNLREPHGTLTLSEGRQLAYDDHGDPSQPAVIYMHGAPACRTPWDGLVDRAKAAGVRLILPDRPGCGRSTHDSGRRIVDWPADVRSLADHLGLERYAVVGESGGGPYALACAADADPRLGHTVVIAGVGPLDSPERIAQLNDINRGVFEVAAQGVDAVRPLVEAMVNPPSSAAQQGNEGDSFAALAALFPPEDIAAIEEHPDLMAQLSDLSEAAVQGTEGLAYDLWLFTQPWGFDLGAIPGSVDFYTGDHDRNVPLQQTIDQAAAVPRSTLTVWPSAGHLAGLVNAQEVFERLLRL